MKTAKKMSFKAKECQDNKHSITPEPLADFILDFYRRIVRTKRLV